MGELAVADDGTIIRTLLGSCLGLALYDRQSRIGGLAHILLPASHGDTRLPAKFVDTAIPAVIEQIRGLAGSRRGSLTAKLAGGANMFATNNSRPIGEQNIEAAQRMLNDLGIPIVSQHLRGQQGRRMQLDTASGRVTIEVVGAAPVEI